MTSPPLPGRTNNSTAHQALGQRLAVLLLSVLAVLGGTLSSPGSALAQGTGTAQGTAPAAPAPSAATGTRTASAPEAPCTSSDPVICSIREMTPQERAEAREIRVRYHQLLGDMRHTEQTMRAEGRSDEEIARVLVDMRNQAKDITRAGMPPEKVEALEQRNIAKYGNPLGPTADQQFAKYGSWAGVIDAATRSSAAVDRELGLAPRQ